jgi:deoxyribose-phosphate aldolase
MSDLASLIDHTLLKQDATEEQIRKVCMEAKEHEFASVCVNPSYVPLVADQLKDSSVKVCCVIGFPLGATTTKTKVSETQEVIENGAQEVDMVINVGAAKSGNWDYVRNDIESVVNAARGKAAVKVIIETCLLNDEEKARVCVISKQAGADFVKTSTGFSTGGATVEDVMLMRKTVGPDMGVKASGGVKDYDTAIAMIKAGATRLGTSSGVAIAKKEKESATSDIKKSLY